MKSRLELRVLGGPALGASIGLSEGRYTLGTDDACDIVLAADAALAGQHMTLEIRKSVEAETETESGGLDVLARPVADARIVLDGLVLPEEGALLPKGKPLSLGLTALAWRLPGEAWEPVTLVPLEFARIALEKKEPAGKNAEAESSDSSESSESSDSSKSPDSSGASVKNAPDGEKTAEENASAAGQGVSPEASTKTATPSSTSSAFHALHYGVFVLLVLLALLLAAGFAMAVFPQWRDVRPLVAQALRMELEQAGLTGLTVAETGDPGALLVSGTVPDDLSRTKLERIAAAHSLRARLEVRVRGDRLRAARETLNAHGFYPEVRERDGGKLALALYLKDGLTESRMLELGKDVPALRGAARRVVYAKDVAAALGVELRALALDEGKVSYLPGKVLLAYQLPPNRAEKLEEALERVRKTLEAPVVFQIGEIQEKRETWTTLPFAPPDTRLAAAQPSGGKDLLGGLKVVSVTAGVIPFVTLSDQQKLFPGAELPNGAVLTGIHNDRLEFARDREILTYFLKETP